MILSVVLATSSAFAHDEAMRSKATHGTIAALRGERFTLNTDDGSVEVTFTDATKVERDEKTIGRDALAPGAHVAVFGTKVPGQGLVAKEIVLDMKAPSESESGHGEHKH